MPRVLGAGIYADSTHQAPTLKNLAENNQHARSRRVRQLQMVFIWSADNLRKMETSMLESQKLQIRPFYHKAMAPNLPVPNHL